MGCAGPPRIGTRLVAPPARGERQFSRITPALAGEYQKALATIDGG
jgi:hypothetical protein